MKLLTSLACLAAAANAFEAGDYIMSRIDDAISQIYTKLDDGYDIHIGNFIHSRKEGNNITSVFSLGFEDTELDSLRFSLAWTDLTINYNSNTKIHLDRYPFLQSFYSDDVSVWEDEFTAFGSCDNVGNINIGFKHIMEADGDAATFSALIKSNVEEVTQSKTKVKLSTNYNADNAEWLQDDFRNRLGIYYLYVPLKYEHISTDVSVEMDNRCMDGPLTKGCSVLFTGEGKVNDDSVSGIAGYKAIKSGYLVLSAIIDGDNHSIRIIGNKKNSMPRSDRFKVVYVHNEDKDFLFSGPTPWGFEENCMDKINTRREVIAGFIATRNKKPINWLLSVMFSDKVAASLPKDFWDITDIFECANIKSPYYLSFLNDKVQPAVNGALEEFQDMFNEKVLPTYRIIYPDAPKYAIKPILKQKSVVDFQRNFSSVSSDITEDVIFFATSIAAYARRTIHSITGVEGEKLFEQTFSTLQNVY